IICGTFTRRRLLLLASLAIAVVMLSGVLSTARILRSSGELGMLASLPEALADNMTGQSFADSLTVSALAFLLRITGMDALALIVRFQPSFDLSRSLWMISGAGGDLNALYADEVLGLRDLVGVAFSTSLMGFFY